MSQIRCPQCGNIISKWLDECEFCNYDLKSHKIREALKRQKTYGRLTIAEKERYESEFCAVNPHCESYLKNDYLNCVIRFTDWVKFTTVGHAAIICVLICYIFCDAFNLKLTTPLWETGGYKYVIDWTILIMYSCLYLYVNFIEFSVIFFIVKIIVLKARQKNQLSVMARYSAWLKINKDVSLDVYFSDGQKKYDEYYEMFVREERERTGMDVDFTGVYRI